MQVAHEHAPPHSATMPLMPLRMAVSITVEPISASTVWVVPSCSMKVICGMAGAALSRPDSHLQYNAHLAASYCLRTAEGANRRRRGAPEVGHDFPDLS